MIIIKGGEEMILQGYGCDETMCGSVQPVASSMGG